MRIQYAVVLRALEDAPLLERKAEGLTNGWPDEVAFQREGRYLLVGATGALHMWNPVLLSGRLAELARRSDGSCFSRTPAICYGINLGTTATFGLLVRPRTEEEPGLTVFSLMLSYDSLSVPTDEIDAAEKRLGRSIFWFELGRLCTGLIGGAVRGNRE